MNEVKVTVKAEGKGLDKVEAEAKQTGAKVGRELEKGFKEGEQAGEKASKKMQGDLDKTAKESGQAGSKIGDSLSKGVEGGFTAGAGAMKAGVAGLAAAIGTTLLAGVAASFQEKQIGGMIAVQTGTSAEAGGKLGTAVGKAFAGNFGDSMEEVQAALTAVLQNKLIDTSASEADLQHLTELAITASQVVGEEANAIGRAAQQLLRNDLAGSAEQAMDIIVKASQNGLNVNEDLIDTIVEYGTQFRELGLSGPEALGLISQAMKGGARDADTAADALKEFAIRARDGSETTVRGFKAIGLDAGQMGDAIAAGGTKAHQALGLTLDGLRAIHDPVLRDQTAIDLFGTKAEDLGNALGKMDLDSAAKEMDGFAGSTQKASDDISAATPVWDTLWRKVGAMPKDALNWATQSDAIDEHMKKVREAIAAKEAAAETEDTFGDRVAAAEDAVRRSTDAIDANTLSLEENIDAASKAADGVLSLWDAQNGHAEAVQKANESLKENGKTLDFHTEKGRANRDALADVAKTTYDQIAAMEAQGATSQEIQGVIAAQRDEFVQLARKMGMSAAEANGLADKLKLIPGNYKANIYADTGQANAAIQNTYGLLAMLRDKTIHLTVQETRFISKEAQFGHFAHGGIVGADSAPILHRQGGGPGHSMIVQNEQGWEITRHPDGSTVIPAGASQQMMTNLAANSGGGWRDVEIRFAGDLDTAFATAFMRLEANGMIRARAR